MNVRALYGFNYFKYVSNPIPIEIALKHFSTLIPYHFSNTVKPSFKQKEVLIELKQGDKQKERLQFSNFGSYTSKLSIKNEPYQLLYDDYDDNKDGEDEVELITNEDYNYLIFNILSIAFFFYLSTFRIFEYLFRYALLYSFVQPTIQN